MSIPSDHPKPTPFDPNNPSIPMGPNSKPVSREEVDPTGVWTAFLSKSGVTATPEQVKIFIQGIMKMFNVMIQQQQKAMKEANERLKRVAKGEDPY